MNIWSAILYVIELLSLIGAVVSWSKGTQRLGKFDIIGGITAFALGLFAIFKLSSQSSAEHATLLGSLYVVLNVVAIPNFIAECMRGSVTFTTRRTCWTVLSAVVGFVIISVLTFTH